MESSENAPKAAVQKRSETNQTGPKVIWNRLNLSGALQNISEKIEQRLKHRKQSESGKSASA